MALAPQARDFGQREPATRGPGSPATRRAGSPKARVSAVVMHAFAFADAEDDFIEPALELFLVVFGEALVVDAGQDLILLPNHLAASRDIPDFLLDVVR